MAAASCCRSAASSQAVYSLPSTCSTLTSRHSPPSAGAACTIRCCDRRKRTRTRTSASSGHSTRHSVWLTASSQSSISV